MEPHHLSMILIAPLWLHREWFPNLVSLIVEEPLEHPKGWNLQY